MAAAGGRRSALGEVLCSCGQRSIRVLGQGGEVGVLIYCPMGSFFYGLGLG